MRTWRALVAPLLAVALVAGACGDDDDDETVQPGPSVSTTVEEETEEGVTKIGVTEEDNRYSFTVPEGIQAGAVTFELDNTGEKVHDFQLVQVGSHSDQELIEFITNENIPAPEWLDPWGGAGSTPPGSKTKATVELAAGEYVYFCTESDEDQENQEEPTGDTTTTTVDPTNTSTTLLQPQAAQAHISKGMLGRFTVSGGGGGALPAADATITAKEYQFVAPASLEAGTSTLKLENDGEQAHHLLLFPIADGKTFDDVKAFVASGEGEEPTGPPPVDFEKGTVLSVIGPDRAEVQEVKLDPGDYAMLCFISDTGTTGPPHVAKGMIAPIKVAE